VSIFGQTVASAQCPTARCADVELDGTRMRGGVLKRRIVDQPERKPSMTRLRNVLVTASMAAILSGLGLGITAQPANAFVTAADQCGVYFYNYNWWDNAAWNEWVQNGDTPYFSYAVGRSNYYSYLFSSNNC
jgi:hypothetical protein